MIDGRTQQLMNLISELKRENQKLRKLLKENQISILLGFGEEWTFMVRG